ncbi:thiolase family protein [Sphingomonas immobilis]|uniref:Thiolase family protein n=1 Tax=Sphingomonas immobilis TaxID=3063997 RepID=A0ABT8ZXZ5_9SPHN|nr:thiolase family protein [Sphingomonas sp. CA1-15]MDO7842148.1 thiolase family protein [Sphingomonas sp. CA1-15]
MILPERKVCISGAGQSEVARPSSRDALALTVDACRGAIAAAGLTPGDIDGLATYPGLIANGDGMSPVGATETMIALGLSPTWVGASTEGHAHMGAIFNAIQAIASGLCRHVLVFRTVAQATARAQVHHAGIIGGAQATTARSWGGMAWQMPYGAVSAAPLFALYAQAYFARYGATSRQLGAIAVNSRRMAALNPNAIYRDPITIEDYLAARMISDPLRIYDCDTHIDGSTAILLSHVDCAADLPRPPILIEAMGMAIGGFGAGLHEGDFTRLPADRAGEMLWSRTELTPADLDFAQIYDGFSILTLLWLEALAICGRGEAAAFVEGGARIALDGVLPLNTGGGQLSAGRFHGYGHLFEACAQLWGEAGARQLADPQVGVVSNGGFGYGALLLRR